MPFGFVRIAPVKADENDETIWVLSDFAVTVGVNLLTTRGIDRDADLHFPLCGAPPGT